MRKLPILFYNAHKTKTIRSIIVLTALTFVLFLGVALMIPVTVRILHDNAIDTDSAQYAGIVSDIVARDNLRGSIFDRSNKLIAESTWNEDGSGQTRNLYYKESVAHVIGTMPDNAFGGFGAEYYFNALLGGLDKVNMDAHRGDDIRLTVDVGLQEAILDVMHDITGGAVVSDVRTGEVLAMVSSPSYDPSESVNADEAARLYTNGEYTNIAMSSLTPGSVFKLFSTCVLTDQNCTPYLETDGGSYSFGELGTISNAKGYEYYEVDIAKAIEKSSNVYFSRAAYELCTREGNSVRTFADGINALGMNGSIGTDLGTVTQSNSVAGGNMWELLQSSFGQGTLLVSPLYVNVFVAAAATDGVMLKPYFLKSAIAPDGKTVAAGKTVRLDWRISEAARANLRQGMLQAANGYGLTLYGQPDRILAKTGTAEISDSRNNAWVTCVFPAEEPRYALTMVKISGKDMSTVLLPYVQQVIDRLGAMLVEEAQNTENN